MRHHKNAYLESDFSHERDQAFHANLNGNGGSVALCNVLVWKWDYLIKLDLGMQKLLNSMPVTRCKMYEISNKIGKKMCNI